MLHKLTLIILTIISLNAFAMKVENVYNAEDIKEIFKKENITILSNGMQIVGYNWGITLADLEDEEKDNENEKKSFAIALKMRNDGKEYVQTFEGMDIYSDGKILQYVKIDKILLIAYARKGAEKTLERNLRKLNDIQLIGN